MHLLGADRSGRGQERKESLSPGRCEAGLLRPPAEISAWRENGGQRYLAEEPLADLAAAAGLALTPRLLTLDAGDLPVGLDTARDLILAHLPVTRPQWTA